MPRWRVSACAGPTTKASGAMRIARWCIRGLPSSTCRRSGPSRCIAMGCRSPTTAKSSIMPSCAPSLPRSAMLSARIRTRKSFWPAGGNGARGCCRASSACSHSRSGTPPSRVLYAARDRFGEKPFLYASSGRALAFGSDLIACEAMLGERRPVDPGGVARLVHACGSFRIRLRLRPGVRKLPPGHVLRFDDKGVSVTPWYDLASARAAASGGYGDVSRRNCAGVSTRRCPARLVADVPVGVFLSGGINSALVAASVAATGAKLKTFTVGFRRRGRLLRGAPARRCRGAASGRRAHRDRGQRLARWGGA